MSNQTTVDESVLFAMKIELSRMSHQIDHEEKYATDRSRLFEGVQLARRIARDAVAARVAELEAVAA